MSKITHEQAEYYLLLILKDDSNEFETSGQFTFELKDYISQQAKQEKLLELYKEILKRVNLKFYSKGNEWVNFEKYLLENKTINDNTSLAEIFKQIKELENE